MSKIKRILANLKRMGANELIANVIFYLTALKKWFVYRLKMIANLKPRLVILNGVFRLLYPIRWNSLIRLNSLRIRSYSLKKRLAQVVLASQLLNLLLPFMGLVSPLQANNLIKPTQKGDSLFESVNPGFTAEFGDRGQPTQHKLRFEAKPELIEANDKRMEANELMATAQKVKETLLGPETKGVELKLVSGSLISSDSLGAEGDIGNHSLDGNNSLIGDNSLQAEGLISSNSLENNESLKEINKGLEETKSSLEKIEEKLTSVSKDIAEVTKVTKNILEESGVGKPELSVRPSMEETPEDFARTADPQAAPPSAYSLPIDTVSQTIDDQVKVEYQIVVGRGVKESITLLEGPSSRGIRQSAGTVGISGDGIATPRRGGARNDNQFTFELTLDPGVQVKQAIDGIAESKKQKTKNNEQLAINNQQSTIYFVDSFGRYLFHFETPYMVDAAGARSSAVSLAVSTQEKLPGVLYLTLTADQNWLMDSARVFPVLIDPTIVHENNPAFASGTENRSQTTNTPSVELQYQELQPDINTVGLWHFNSDNNVEQTLYDSSGNINDLTRGASTSSASSDPLWSINGQVGHTTYNALEFDGSDDYATRADDADFDFAAADNFTVEAWVKHDNTTSAAKYILTKADATTGGYKLYMDASGDFCFDIDDDATWTPDDTACTSAIDYDDNTWHHVAGVKYGTTAIKLYVDGKEVATDTAIAATATLANTNALYIGVDRDGTSNEWDGLIDEVRISRVARSPEEIAASASRFPYAVHESPVIDFGSTPNTLDSLTYSATGVQTGDGEKPFSTDGLVAQWNLNETSGTTAYNTGGADSCGGTPSSCNGTLTNMTTSSQDAAAGDGWTANNRRWGAGALMFDGTDGLVSIANNSSLNLSLPYSIEFWMKANNGSAWDVIISRTPTVGSAWNYLITTNDSGGQLRLATGGAGYNMNQVDVTDGNWHHVAVTIASSGTLQWYVDGLARESYTGVSTSTGTSVTCIGDYQTDASTCGSTYDYDGTLDAIRIYSRALTASEILANAQSANIEFQTRTGATATPNDGTWEAWKTTSGTGDTQIASMDTDSANWSEDNQNPASSGIVDSDDSTTKFEGTGSLKMQIGNPTVETSAVALYHLEETSGTGAYIQDSSATNADGTPTGTTVVDGFYGKGRKFSSTSDYIDIGTTTPPTNISIEAWIYLTDTGCQTGTGGNYCMIWASDDTSQNGTSFYLKDQGGGNGFTFYVASDTSNYRRWDGSYSFKANNWYHVAVTQSGVTGTPTMYVNGTSVTVTLGVTLGTPSGRIAANTRIGDDNATALAAEYFRGLIDEVRILNGALSADSVAEAYRAGRDHRISKTISTQDLTGKTKLPFYVASDRTGTWAELSSGESAYANYEPDANTVGLWHLEEQTGTANTYLKDSSGNGNNSSTITGTTFVQGKLGKARSFNGSSDFITTTNTADNLANFSVEAWVKTSSATSQILISKATNINVDGTGWALFLSIGIPYFRLIQGASIWKDRIAPASIADGMWHHLVGTKDSSLNMRLYLDGVSVGTDGGSGTITNFSNANSVKFGQDTNNTAGLYFNGSMDEVRISNSARTADEIRQAYEIGRRSHPVTIDFSSAIDSTNLITSASDLTFALSSNIKYQSSNINVGEKIIVRENVGGTEYIAQGTVSGVTYGSGVSNANAPNQALTNAASTVVTVTSWDGGSTFPTGGFTLMASVFKWQREFMDLSPISLASHRDAITRITLRVSDASQGATVWLDDFESADYSGGAMTSSNSASISIGSTAQRYFQYRAILTTRAFTPLDAQLSNGATPALTNVQINYNSGTTPQTPKTKDASSDFATTGSTLNRVVDSGSGSSPQLELAYKELPKDINTVGLWHMNEVTDNTCSGGQDACDSSGNANHGTATGTTIVDGKINKARSFNGTSDYINVGNGTSLALTGSQTHEAWIYFDVTSGYRIMLNHTSQSILVMNGTFCTASELEFAVVVGGQWKCAGVAISTITAGTWYHVAGTYDGASVKLYINGAEKDSTSQTGAVDAAGGDYYIGNNNGVQYFDGSIDEVRISNIARSPEEIKADAQRRPYGVYTSEAMNLGTDVSSIDNLRWTENGVQTGDGETPYSTNGLVAQWNFNETSGTNAANSTNASCGSTCNGTLTSFASTASQDQAAGTGWTKDNRKWGAGAINIASAATADTITVSDPASNQLDPNSSDLTLGMWVKTSDVTAELLSNNANNGTACTANGYYLGIDASGYPNFYLDTNGATAGCDAQISTGITTKINDGQWHFLSVAVTRGTSALLYLDGVQIGSDTSVTSYSSITVTGNIQIASSANYDGVIDVINFYSRALGASEILSNYQAGNVELQTRTGATTTPNDGTWEAWKPTTSETALDAVDSLSPVEKISQTSLTAYWKLDETSGTRADSKGSNTLTDNNTVTYAPGRLSNAAQFTAANSEYLSITDNAALSTGDIDFSIATWVYLDSRAADNAHNWIVGKGTGTGSLREWELLYNTSPGVDTFRFFISGDGSSANAIVDSSIGVPKLSAWYYIVAWHDSTANTTNIQVNNGAVSSTATSGTAPSDRAGTLEIGREPGATAYLDGKLDEVGFWKRTLTAAERTRLFEDGLDLHASPPSGGALYRSLDSTTKIEGAGSEKLQIGAPQVDANTVALWHLEETSGTGAYIKDATTNANHGTPTGTTVVDGFYGKARKFTNGYLTDYISTSKNIATLMGNDTSGSIDAWIYPTTTSGSQYILSDHDSAGANNSGNFYVNASQLTVCFKTSSLVCTTGGTINPNNWYHVAGTYNGSNVIAYVNGSQVNSAAQTGNLAGGTSNLTFGRAGADTADTALSYYGIIDEVRLSTATFSAEEIAEAYRAGRDHRITKSFGSAQDLSAKTKLPFYIASDRPGTFLEATVGESGYANYEPDANTVGLWHLEEALDASGSIKDSSGNGNNGTLTSAPPFVQGKIGKARDFDGTADYVTVTDSSSIDISGAYSVSAWVYVDTLDATNQYIAMKGGDEFLLNIIGTNNTIRWLIYEQPPGTGIFNITSNAVLTTGTWYHIVGTWDGTTNTDAAKLYVNGSLDKTATPSGTQHSTKTGNLYFGAYQGSQQFLDGKLDEISISNTARSADEIRQAYEVGKRTHQITNDFVTTPQAAYSSGTSVTINNPYGTTNLTDTLSIGETMIFKENVGGTETVSQAVVTNIVNTSSVYGTVTLLAAPTFPSGGFSTNATVFKWQREFFDTSASLSTSRDAINRITLRITDGSAGANVWLDDIKSAGPYLSVGSARTSTIASTPQQYFQYRIIFSTTDTSVTPSVTAVSLQYHSDPQKVTGADTFASGTYDNDGNVQLGSNNVKDVAFYDRTKDQISYALETDGTNDFVDIGTGPTSVKTVEFWVYPETTTEYFINLTSTTDYIWVNAGTVTATGFAAPIIYVDGAVSSTLVADKWQHVVITDTTGENASNFDIGRTADTNYLEGKIDEVALFSDVRTPAEVASDYNARRLAGTEDALVAVYHFDEGSGTRAADPTGNFHGTLTNMTDDDWVNSLSDRDQSALSQQTIGVDPNWTNGPSRRSHALDFDGSADYISAGTSLNVTGTTITVETWIKSDVTSYVDIPILVSKWVNGGTAGNQFSLMVNGASGCVAMFGTDTGSAVATYATGTTNVCDGKWYHLAGVQDGTSVRVYVNGKEENSNTPVRTMTSQTTNTTIGNKSGLAANQWWNGKIDEIRISNTARYSSSFTPSYRFKEDGNTVALWHFDEGENNTCSGGTNDTCDSSSNGYDGAETSTPTWVTDSLAIMDNNGRYVALGASSAVNTDRGMELKITSTTAFQYRWQGDQTWTTPSTSTLSSYSFSSPAQIDSTGVYVGFDTSNGTFGDESYFLIPSWALEQFSNSDTQNAMRGTKRGFPERSYLIATDKGVDILNADDNTLWMRLEQGSGRSLGTDFNNDPSSIFMSHGQLLVGTNGSAGTGLYRYDFNRDKIYRYNATNRTTNTVNIAKRNTADSSYGSADTGQNLISSVVNDAHALTIQGKLLLAAATDTGVTKISNIMSSDTSYDYSDNASDDYGHVVLAETAGGAGDVYADNDTTDALERWNNVLDDAASETAGTPDTTYDESSTPAIFTSAQEINDLTVISSSNYPLISSNSPVNILYLAHDAGATALVDNRSAPTDSHVKYYTKDYVSEELIGDTNGFWPLNETSGTRTDQSVKTNDLTDNNTVTSASGVRGTAAQFTAANSEYLSIADNASLSTGDFDFSVSGWLYMDSKPASSMYFISKHTPGGGAAQQEYNLRWDAATDRFLFAIHGEGKTVSANNLGAPALATWYYVVAWHDAAANTINIQVNNGTVDSTATAGDAPVDSAADFRLSLSGFSVDVNGRIDEVMFTKEVLTAAQRTQLYVSGKEALNNKYRVKLASDTVNELAGDDNTVKAIAASKLNQTGVTRGEYLYVGTNGTSADDGILSRVLVNGDTRDATYDEANTEPYVVTDNDINSLSVSSDGAYIIVGSDDSGVTIIQSGSSATRMRGGKKTQGGMKRPNN